MQTRYPAHREADVVLRDGSTVHVRPVREDDATRLADFLVGLSERSRWLRFFSAWSNLGDFAEKASDIDYRDRFGLVATVGTEPVIVGHAMYGRTHADHAEIAFTVSDDYQGKGLGTILLGHLAEAAQDNGIQVFEAVTLPENHQMIDVFRHSGFPVRTRSLPGEVVVEFPASLSPEAMDRFEQREGVAAEAALRVLLHPRSIAVIGASRRRESIAGVVFHNLIASGFNGPVYPVNPHAEVVQSVAAYPSVLDVPGEIDLGVVVTPAPRVAEIASECARKGVRGLLVISAGFGEIGEEGLERQRELLRICRASGMRLIGPNCIGIMNTHPEVRLNASFAPTMPPRGRVGFMTQSGALGLAVIDRARLLGLGISSFASVGNKADISGNDLLNYWEADPETDLVLLYLESFGNPRRFSRIARRVGRHKPIVAVKSGRSGAGARATSSHTGALIAASDVTVDALFRQAGVIRCDTLGEMFDVASLLANQPPPNGRSVGIITNAGGPGILCADACEAEGLAVPPLGKEAKTRLAEFLPAEAALDNPVDMIASASADDYRRAIDAVVAHSAIEALVVIFIPPLVTRTEDVARAVRDAVATLPRPIPVLGVFMTSEGVPDELASRAKRIPVYAFPEEAARALARAAEYGAWCAAPEGSIPTFDNIARDEATGLLAASLQTGSGWLEPDEVARMLDCYGLTQPQWRLADDPDAAAQAAADIAAPVALKAVGPDILHKTELGGVRLNLRSPDAVRREAAAMKKGIPDLERFLVQAMAASGTEMLVGVSHDPVFGPVLALGAGGTAVELLKDIAVRITPLTDVDAKQMMRSLQTFPLLQGYRGAPEADLQALEETLLRVSAMVENHREIAEMDCNPVIVGPHGALVVDARIRVESVAPPLPLGARRPI